MRTYFYPALVVLGTFTLLCGVVYPFAMTALAQTVFPHQANGSVIATSAGGFGSELMGQQFSDAAHFWSRPSATSPANNALASSGSNLGPLNSALAEAVKARRAAHEAIGDPTPVPVELLTASGSGLDPHLSPAAARYQMPRVARARGLTDAEVEPLITENTESRTLGLLGEARVNVMRLNRALDAKAPKR